MFTDVNTNLRKTILYIGGFELPDKNAAAHRVIANGKALRVLGYSVVFFDSTRECNKFKGRLSPIQEFEGFSYYSTSYPRAFKEWVNYSSNITIYKEYMDRHANEIAGIILYNHFSLATIKFIRYCKRHNIPVLADCTEWYHHKKSNFIGLIKWMDSELRMRILNKKNAGIIVISQYLKNYYGSSLPTFSLPPLVDCSESKWNKPKEYLRNECMTVVYAGSPGRKDMLDNLIEAVAQCPFPIMLKIIGITEEQFLKLYSSVDIIDNSRIDFLGRISHVATLNEVIEADYTCFFRERNRVSMAGFPTKFVESITAKTPVITNSTSDLEKYCARNDACVFVDDISVGSIKKGLEDAYHHKRVVKDNTIFDYHNYLDEFKRLSGLFSGK